MDSLGMVSYYVVYTIDGPIMHRFQIIAAFKFF